jgi:hypothetical protein
MAADLAVSAIFNPIGDFEFDLLVDRFALAFDDDCHVGAL